MDKEEIEGLFIGEVNFASVFEEDIERFRIALTKEGYKTVWTEEKTYEIWLPAK